MPAIRRTKSLLLSASPGEQSQLRASASPRSTSSSSYMSLLNTGQMAATPAWTEDQTVEMLQNLNSFLTSAPQMFTKQNTARHPAAFRLTRITLCGQTITCVNRDDEFLISGTDVVKILTVRFFAFGRKVDNFKKFEEGIFSDLRNMKENVDMCMEDARSELLNFLNTHGCIRTQKRQKVFYWKSVPHDSLFLEALDRDLKREFCGVEPVTIPVREPATKFKYTMNSDISKQFLHQMPEFDVISYILSDVAKLRLTVLNGRKLPLAALQSNGPDPAKMSSSSTLNKVPIIKSQRTSAAPIALSDQKSNVLAPKMVKSQNFASTYIEEKDPPNFVSSWSFEPPTELVPNTKRPQPLFLHPNRLNSVDLSPSPSNMTRDAALLNYRGFDSPLTPLSPLTPITPMTPLSSNLYQEYTYCAGGYLQLTPTEQLFNDSVPCDLDTRTTLQMPNSNYHHTSESFDKFEAFDVENGPSFRQSHNCLLLSCQASFDSKSTLEKHYESCHKIKQNLRCERCDAPYSIALHLLEHQQICGQNS